MANGTPKSATCKYCGASGLAWRKLANGWRLYEADASGAPMREHSRKMGNCTGAPSTSPSPINIAVTPTVTPTSAPTATATGLPIQSGIGTLPPTPTPDSDDSDTAADAGIVFDMAAAYDAVAAMCDAADAALAVKHDAARIGTYAPKHESDAGTANVPELDRDYLIDTGTRDAIIRVINLARATGIPQNIGLHGPAGSGKTTLGVQIGALAGAPTFVIEAAAKQTADEWYGEATGVDRESGVVTYRASRFVQAIETPGAVVVINDVALLQSRTVQNGLNEILDPSTRGTWIEALDRRVTVAPGVIIVGTWNVGAEYTGASPLSLQLLDRFRAGALFEVPYPSDGTLAAIIGARSGVSPMQAARLSAVADWMRADSDPIELSTRGLIAAASHIVHGATIGQALFYTVLGDLDAGERARAYGIIDVQLGRAAGEADGIDVGEREEWDAPRTGQYVKLAESGAIALVPVGYDAGTPDSDSDTAASDADTGDAAGTGATQ